MSFEIVAVRNRTINYSGTLYEADGTTAISVTAGSVARFKAWRRNNTTPNLDLDSVGATGSGSVLTISSAGAWTLKIAQGDTSDLVPGVYDAEISLVDAGDSNRIKSAELGTLHILESGGGDISTT